MKTYTEMAFEELLKYKARLIDDRVWAHMDAAEKKEINDELERKQRKKETNK